MNSWGEADSNDQATDDPPPRDETLPLAQFHLRCFLTSTCNLRCVYCNPDAHHSEEARANPNDVLRAIRVGYRMGVRKVHFSGGEPTLHRSLPEFLSAARDLGYAERAMTTNGLIFADRYRMLVESGLTRVNISLDSLDPVRNATLTGRRTLPLVRRAIDAAVREFGTVKVNVVLMPGILEELEAFLSLVAEYDGRVVLRFIELSSNQPVFFEQHDVDPSNISAAQLISALELFSPLVSTDIVGKNPECRYYALTDLNCVVGVIATRTNGYPCRGCHKLRLSPYGDMGVCVTADGINVRDATDESMEDAMRLLAERRARLDIVAPDRLHLSDAKGFWRWGDVSVDFGRSVPVTVAQIGSATSSA